MCTALYKATEALKTAIAATLDEDDGLCPTLTLEVLDKLIGGEVER